MPVFVRNSAGVWVRGNNPTTLPLWVRQPIPGVPTQSYWRGVGNVWLRDADTWRQLTDYVGTPGAPSNLRVTSTSTQYDLITLAWDAPTTGAPVTGYAVYWWDGNGVPISPYNEGEPTHFPGNVLSYSAGVAPDQRLQFEVVAYGPAGAESARSNRVRYEIGHPQQTQQVPVSGWGTPYDADTITEHVSSQFSTFVGTNVTDGNFATDWWGVARAGTQYAEGTRVYPAGRPYARVYAVKVWPNSAVAQRVWLGLYMPATGWITAGGFGGFPTYLTNPALWSNSTNVAVYAHPYFWEGGEQATFFNFVIPTGIDVLTDRSTIDVAIDRLKFISSGWRSVIAEIIIAVQDWVTTYNTVVTVNQKNNGYW